MPDVNLSPPQVAPRSGLHNGGTPASRTASARTTNARLDGHTSPAFDGSDEGAAILIQANDGLNRISEAYIAVTSDNIAAMIEGGALAGRLMTDMTKSYIDALNYTAVTYAGLGRACLTCRTPADIVEFQKKAIEEFTETCESASKVYSGLLERFSTAFEPLMARSADGPEHMFRAVAG